MPSRLELAPHIAICYRRPIGATNYLYDGYKGIEEVDQTGNALARYAQDIIIDEPLAQLRSGMTSYYERDAIDSVTSLSNSAATLAGTFTYDSFGKLTASTGTVTNPLQYTAREFDAETGIYEYRARYYDQNVGRFLSEDPTKFDGGINFYAYVTNDPVDFSDPNGLKRTCTTKIMLVTAYCDKKKHTASGTIPGPGTVAVANTNSTLRPNPTPIPYPFGCSVTVDNAAAPGNDWQTEYEGTVRDTGAGWDSRWKSLRLHHHDVLPNAWVDIWMSNCKKAFAYNKYRTVTICCNECDN